MTSTKEPEKVITTESFDENASLGNNGVTKKDDTDVVAADSSSVILDSERRVVAERQLLHKLDFRLMPMIILIYLMNYIDVSISQMIFS